MTYQKLIVAVDHGNCNTKTNDSFFTSGIIESDCKPVLGEYLYYNGRYYTLSDQRIPYMRDKTKDERFFILTLFAIAMEAEGKVADVENTILNVDLPIGLPPKHYEALFEKFQNYFKGRGKQVFTYKGREYTIKIGVVVAFPQDYAAAMTIFPQIQGYNKRGVMQEKKVYGINITV